MIDGLDGKIRWMAYIQFFSIKSRNKQKQKKNKQKKTLIAI